jgi:hypothetical protein
MEAKGEISMRMVHCEDCGKRYDYDVDGEALGDDAEELGADENERQIQKEMIGFHAEEHLDSKNGAAGPPRPLSPLRHSRSGQGGSSGNWEKISVRQRWPWAGC